MLAAGLGTDTSAAWNEKLHHAPLSKSGNHSLRDACDSIRWRIYVFPVQPNALSRLIDFSVRAQLEIIHMAKAKNAAALGIHLHDIHENTRRTCVTLRMADGTDFCRRVCKETVNVRERCILGC